jgi:hypothetical protein
MTFAARLAAYREAHQWSNPALAQTLSQKIGRTISVRTLESWIQGRKPHKLWREQLEKAISC